jgi:hypothetical protein
MHRHGYFLNFELNAKLKWLLLALVVLIAGAFGSGFGDPPPGEIVNVRVTQSGNDIMFYLPPTLDAVAIELWDLVVNKRTETDGRSVDHTVWRLEGRRSPSGHLLPVKWPIKYGAHLANIDPVVPAVPLSPGGYIFGADIFVRHGSEPVQKSKLVLLDGSFSLNAEMRLE